MVALCRAPALGAEAPLAITPHQIIRLPHRADRDDAPVVTGVALSPRGDLIATAGDDHLVWIWQAADGKFVRKLRGHDDWVRTLAFHPSGNHLASAGDDGRIIIWNVATGEMVHRLGGRPVSRRGLEPQSKTPHVPEADCIYRILYSPDGSQLAAAGFQGTISLYNAATAQIEQRLNCPTGTMRTMEYSPDGSQLAAGGRNGQIRIWNTHDGRVLRDLAAGPQRIRTLAFSHEGDRVAAAGDGPYLRVWEVASGAELTAFVARPGRIMALVFCGPNEIATGGSDNVIRIWNLERMIETHRLAGHEGSVSALEFNPAEATLVSGSFDTTVRFWRLPSASAAATARAPVARPRPQKN